MTSNRNQCMFNTLYPLNHLNIYFFPYIKSLSVFWDDNNTICFNKGHGYSCAAVQRCGNQLITYFAKSYPYVFPMLQRRHKPSGNNCLHPVTCLLYTSDAADEEDSVDLGGRRIIKKKK